jgi:glycosyltransferase involved in cell wall biosynthesis
MAAGLPIIASDIPDNRHFLNEGQAGRLAPEQDPSALAKAILEMLDSRDLAARLGQAARERARERFSLEAMVQRHVELFRNLTG